MKFGKFFRVHANEWDTGQCIEYKKLKQILDKELEYNNHPNPVELGQQSKFLACLYTNVVNFQQHFELSVKSLNNEYDHILLKKPADISKKELLAIHEQAITLTKYKELNLMALTKILKKYEKKTQHKTCSSTQNLGSNSFKKRYFSTNINTRQFRGNSEKLESIVLDCIAELKTLYDVDIECSSGIGSEGVGDKFNLKQRGTTFYRLFKLERVLCTLCLLIIFVWSLYRNLSFYMESEMISRDGNDGGNTAMDEIIFKYNYQGMFFPMLTMCILPCLVWYSREIRFGSCLVFIPISNLIVKVIYLHEMQYFLSKITTELIFHVLAYLAGFNIVRRLQKKALLSDKIENMMYLLYSNLELNRVVKVVMCFTACVVSVAAAFTSIKSNGAMAKELFWITAVVKFDITKAHLYAITAMLPLFTIWSQGKRNTKPNCHKKVQELRDDGDEELDATITTTTNPTKVLEKVSFIQKTKKRFLKLNFMTLLPFFLLPFYLLDLQLFGFCYNAEYNVLDINARASVNGYSHLGKYNENHQPNESAATAFNLMEKFCCDTKNDSECTSSLEIQPNESAATAFNLMEKFCCDIMNDSECTSSLEIQNRRDNTSRLDKVCTICNYDCTGDNPIYDMLKYNFDLMFTYHKVSRREMFILKMWISMVQLLLVFILYLQFDDYYNT